MTVSSELSEVIAVGNGAWSTTSVNFRVFSSSHLEVVEIDTNGAERLLVENTDYTVTNQDAYLGWNINLIQPVINYGAPRPLPSGYSLRIRRVPPYTQDVDLRNAGTFRPETHENEFDYLTMLAHRLRDSIVALSDRVDSVAATPGQIFRIMGSNSGYTDVTTDPIAGSGIANFPAIVGTEQVAYRSWVQQGGGTTQVFTATAGQTDFTVSAYTMGINAIEVYRNGSRLTPGADYTELTSTSFRLTIGAQAGDTIVASSISALPRSVVDDANVVVTQPLSGAVARGQHDKNAEWVSVMDFGAKGDGTTNDSAAFAQAFSQSRYVYCPYTSAGYKISSNILIQGDLFLDLRGSTLKPSGAINMINSATPTQAASTTVSSGATRGSRSIVVASATGLAVGQWVKIDANDSPTNDASSYPTFWGKINGIVSTTITVDRVLPLTYSGTITLQAFADANMKGELRIFNGFIDGTSVTSSGTTGSAIRASGFKRVLLDGITFLNFASASGTIPVQIYQCVDATIQNCTTRDHLLPSSTNFFDIQECRIAEFGPCNTIDGSGFGVNLTRCEVADASFNTLLGRVKKEADDAIGQRSTRGIKFYGCAMPRAIGNHVSQYDSPLKFEANFQLLASNNVLTMTRRSSGGNGIAINIAAITAGAGTHQFGGIVANNVIVGCGLGIGLQDNNTGLVVIDTNYVEDCDQYAMYLNTSDVVATNNIIKDWGANGVLIAGIYHTNGATVVGNRFSNSPQPTYPCINNNLSTGKKYDLRDNTCATANPIYTSSQLTENSGSSSILSGTTSITINHGLIKAPAASEIQITWTNNPTNDPGNWWISGISATQFTVSVRANPGASNATFDWRANLAMPFTA